MMSRFSDFVVCSTNHYMKGSGKDRGNPHQHDFEILECKVNLRL